LSGKVRKKRSPRKDIRGSAALRRNHAMPDKRRVDVAAARMKSRKSASHTLRALLIEVPIYAVLVVAYFFLVLHFVGDWLGHLYKTHTLLYALVAVAVVIGQAVVLEFTTTLLLRLFQGGRSE
jgi:hypothetical protein